MLAWKTECESEREGFSTHQLLAGHEVCKTGCNVIEEPRSIANHYRLRDDEHFAFHFDFAGVQVDEENAKVCSAQV